MKTLLGAVIKMAYLNRQLEGFCSSAQMHWKNSCRNISKEIKSYDFLRRL